MIFKVNNSEPIRLNHFLSQQGVSSRREADVLIEKRLIKVNGLVAGLGLKVEKGDEVEVLNLEHRPVQKSYFIFHQPAGFLVPKSWNKLFKTKLPIHPQEPLGQEESGIVIFSNDGRLAGAMSIQNFPRTYLIKVDKKINPAHLKQMETGLKLEKDFYRVESAKRISEQEFELVVGKNLRHLIKRLLAACGYQPKMVKRISWGPLALGTLRVGTGRELTKDEEKTLLGFLRLI